jgi:hypothetical protein
MPRTHHSSDHQIRYARQLPHHKNTHLLQLQLSEQKLMVEFIHLMQRLYRFGKHLQEASRHIVQRWPSWTRQRTYTRIAQHLFQPFVFGRSWVHIDLEVIQRIEAVPGRRYVGQRSVAQCGGLGSNTTAAGATLALGGRPSRATSCCTHTRQ